ncbi:MAG: hypothetical protein ABR61_01965 [Actinobacteria bacterium BACL2 MAG-120813-bin23]|jgi:hypothetical protein|uniref:Uncharacterized protein n=1 Tax=Actinobacteria bacterium BACL2 MAG-120813-bin23 TaxID=1655569 RepID=A0A0R2Q557_9ACTN|nr:MAG: hypothetical protein ABR61_01965 [Actinobacteria bacterium BACL2 MAG-120813-bin23]KRO74482.1 MAG: hypothetical protein ABS00_00605 [Actinobacteria bacterium BACL2 MAG-120920-bin34]
MKETRASFALLIFIIIAHIAHLLPQSSSTSIVTQSYPATACPAGVSGAQETALLASKNIEIRNINQPNVELKKNGSGSYPLNRGAILVAGNVANTNVIMTRSGKWTSAATCTISGPVNWFVGGTANVTSQSKLILINSGLSDALIDLTAYSESGSSQSLPVTVRASSEKVVRIDSLSPGSERIVLKVETRSGRVTSYLLDERVRGLSNIGADFVPAISEAGRELVIAGLSVKLGSNSSIKHTLRLMSVGEVDASASVEIISPDGVYVPVEIGEISLNAREVTDIDLSGVDFGSKTFALKINATNEIVASVLSEVKSGSISDFTWSAPSRSFNTVNFNIYGLEPVMSFVGERIILSISWRDRQGRGNSELIRGDEIVNWRVPPNARLMTINSTNPVVAAMSWKSGDGVARLGIAPSTNLESATKPVADIAVIQPRG